MKTLIILLLIPFLAQAEDPTELLNKYYDYYSREYEGYLKSKYELNVSESYWKKVKDVKAFGAGLELKSQELISKAHQLEDKYYHTKNSDLDATEKLSFMRAAFMDLFHQKNTLDQYSLSLNKARSTPHFACGDSHVQEMVRKLDPELMYAIPQYMFDPSGAPKLDISYYFSLSYNYGSSFETGGGAETNLSDGQGMVVYGGAALVTGAAMAFGVVEPTTLSAIFAGSAAVLKFAVDIYSSINGSHEYAKKMKKLQGRYTDLNHLIAQKHKQISSIRSEIIRARCEETIGVQKESDKSVLPLFLDGLSAKTASVQRTMNQLYEALKEDLQKEEKLLLDRIVSDKEFFRKQAQVISKKYSDQMNKLFEYEIKLDSESLMYFLGKPAQTLTQYQSSRNLQQKMRNMNVLWDEIIIGNARFQSEEGPQSINWQAMKEGLENVLQMEAP